MSELQIIEFIRESNYIERIYRDGTDIEIEEFKRFLSLPSVSIEDLQKFVSVYQPDAQLRDKYDLNVRVGNYYPPFGNPNMIDKLNDIIKSENSAYVLHINYEKLHPFTDCNGRSGRALWAWKMKSFEGSFLLNFYFQTLQSK